MSRPRTPRFDEYLAGAFFGYGLSLLPALVISYLLQVYKVDPLTMSPILLGILFIPPYFFGGMMGGYLVARRSDVDHLKVGIKTGIGCLVLQGFIGGLFTSNPEPIAFLLAIFSGAGFGGYLYGKIYQKRVKTLDKENN